MAVRRELQPIVDALLAASEASREVKLDAIGEAIGVRAVTPQDIEAIMEALGAAGRIVVSPQGGGGEANLKKVLASARALGPTLGRKPNVAEIAAHAGLAEEDVRHALALAQIMQR